MSKSIYETVTDVCAATKNYVLSKPNGYNTPTQVEPGASQVTDR